VTDRTRLPPATASPTELSRPVDGLSSDSPSSPISPRYSPVVLRLRKWQIVAVVVGVHFGLIWLIALSWRVFWLAYLSMALLAVAWTTIPILGGLAIWLHHREQRTE
jgi:hypothetical protein